MRARLDRNADRRITMAGLALAGGFLVAAAASLLLPDSARLATWLPIHLALAGAASVAIASVMPFFTTSLSAAPPAPAPARITAIALVALGAALVAGRAATPGGPLPVAGGLAYLAGVLVLIPVAFGPLRRALGPKRPLVLLAYTAALLDVLLGATLPTLFLAGWLPVVGGWATIRAAHAWLNLLGFVSLVIAGTLVHFLPTVLGGRMRLRRSTTVAVPSLVAGPPLVALALVGAGAGVAGLGADLVARAGALSTLAGVAALLAFGLASWRERGRWTTDPGWHHLTGGGLLCALGWFGLAAAAAAGRVLAAGATPDAWRAGEVIAPFAVGWAAQAIVASASHLLPAIGPGTPQAHARQRAVLGIAGELRLVALNIGVALLAVGLPSGLAGAVAAGAVLAAAAVVGSAGVAVVAVVQGRQVAAAANRQG